MRRPAPLSRSVAERGLVDRATLALAAGVFVGDEPEPLEIVTDRLLDTLGWLRWRS